MFSRFKVKSGVPSQEDSSEGREQHKMIIGSMSQDSLYPHIVTPLKRAMVPSLVFIMMALMFLSTLTPNPSLINTAITFSLSVCSESKDYT